MSDSNLLDSSLSDKTSILGLRLWVVISIGVGVFILLILLLLMVLLAMSRRTWNKVLTSEKSASITIPTICKDIEEVVVDHQNQASSYHKLRDHFFPSNEFVDVENEIVTFRNEDAYVAPEFRTIMEGRLPEKENRKQILSAYGHDEKSIDHSGSFSKLKTVKDPVGVGARQWNSPSTSGHLAFTFSFSEPRENSLPSWGRCYTLHELKLATNNFAASNVLGKGGHGVVYQGLLPNGSPIAVKNLLNNRGQAEKEFRVEVETIGRIRHKNLVLLLGYCAEGLSRMLVYEYIDNGNLQQWLHEMLGAGDPLPWNSRMKIALQTAKGIAYLHEGVDPKVVHRDVKSSNILLDKNWDAKISDFGLAKLLDSGKTHVMTRVMGTFGYVAPEYASTGLLTERSDVYSFGVLMMEIITGKKPVDHSRPAGEVNLVDWMKVMIGGRHYEEVIDPRLTEKPSARALKRALLVGLKCVDPDADKRPTMVNVVQMLERDDYYVQNAQRSPALNIK